MLGSALQKVSTAALLAVSLSPFACSQPEIQTESAADATASKSNTYNTSIHERTMRRFARGAFFQPDAESLDGHLRWMAPLIVQQMPDVPAIHADDAQRFGALDENPSQQLVVDSERLTVYVRSATVPLADRVHQQLTYFWFYPPASHQRKPRWRGFRMTLTSDGFPAIWEICSDGAKRYVIFVSKSLETAAGRLHGPPLAGRRFAVEPSAHEHPNVVVARVLDDGPQPMGPYVYLDRESLTVTTLLCRCMPPQVDQFAPNIYYQIVPVGDINELTESRLLPQDLGLPPASQLTTALRLPVEF
jgi:hypothetical protein